MSQKSGRVTQLITCTPAAAFDAFVSPDKITQFWMSAASAPLSEGAQVTWHFMVPGVADTLHVDKLDPPHHIHVTWSDGMEMHLEFNKHGAGQTEVAAEFSVGPDDSIDQIVDTAAGYAIVLCDLKTYLEAGRSANLVRSKAQLIASRMHK